MITGLCKVVDAWLGEGVLVQPGNGDAGPFLTRRLYNELGGLPEYDQLTEDPPLQAAWLEGRHVDEVLAALPYPSKMYGSDEALLITRTAREDSQAFA